MRIECVNSAIPLSGAVGYKQGTQNSPLVMQDKIIDSLGDLLVSVGWTRTAIEATGTISYPLSFPVSPGIPATPKATTGCGTPILRLDGMAFSIYDPFTEIPPSGAPCKFVALDTTPAGGLSNLVAAINTYSLRYTATWTTVTSGGHSIPVVTITARDGGGSFNYPFFAADGRWGVNSEISGGGWQLVSVENRDAGGNLRTGQYTVKVTSSGNINFPVLTRPVHFAFTTPYNTTDVTLTINSATYATFDFSLPVAFGNNGRGYSMIGNPYSFAVYCVEAPTFTSLFAASPYIPTEEAFQSAYALLVAPGFTSSTSGWTGAGVALDGALQFVPGGYSYPRTLAWRKAGTFPLLTPSGVPIISNAWVMFGRNSSDTPAVVGRLWDVAVVNDLVATGSVIDGKQYATIASQGGSGGVTRNSLLMRVEN